jgi:hypothetical protein
MRKKLSLHRETLRTLDSELAAGWVAGGRRVAHETYDSGETYCWCSVGCPAQSNGCPDPGPIETSGCNHA